MPHLPPEASHQYQQYQYYNNTQHLQQPPPQQQQIPPTAPPPQQQQQPYLQTIQQQQQQNIQPPVQYQPLQPFLQQHHQQQQQFYQPIYQQQYIPATNYLPFNPNSFINQHPQNIQVPFQQQSPQQQTSQQPKSPIQQSVQPIQQKLPTQQPPQQQPISQDKMQQVSPDFLKQQEKLLEEFYQNYFVEVFEKYNKFLDQNIGSEYSKFTNAPLSTQKECNSFLLRCQSGRNVHNSSLPFTLPFEVSVPNNPLTKLDIIQNYFNSVATLLVLMKLSNEPSLPKIMGFNFQLILVKLRFLIEKLAKSFQNLSEQQLTQSTTTSTTSIPSRRNNNPIIKYFNEQFELVKNLNEYYITSEIGSDTLVYFTQTLFSILTNKDYFGYIDKVDWKIKNQIFHHIFVNLRYIVEKEKDSKYKYYFACFCFSYFKEMQVVYQVSSNRFVSFKSKKPPPYDEKIHDYLTFYLKSSNSSFVEASKNPISDSIYYLLYCKTCSLLDQEEKAHIWIQYFINESNDRVAAASQIQLDEDIEHYREKSWYIQIMKSIEDEKKKRIEEYDRIKKQLQQQQQQQQQNSNNKSPHIIGGQDQDQYHEIKNNLLLEGLVQKNMNHDSSLISSNVLLNLHPPLQSKEVEIAQKRLNERLELYQLKNSKEIPGDGNCQMHALSDQIHGDLNHSQEIRKTIVDWLRKNKDFSLPNGATICQFVHTNSWEDYCNDMSKNGNWGDHLTLLAAAEIFKSKISIISSIESQSSFFIEIIPTSISSDKVILLSHYAEFHYGSLCPLR